MGLNPLAAKASTRASGEIMAKTKTQLISPNVSKDPLFQVCQLSSQEVMGLNTVGSQLWQDSFKDAPTLVAQNLGTEFTG